MKKGVSKLGPYEQDIVNYYAKEKWSISKIARFYKCCNEIVKRVLDKYNVPMRSLSEQRIKYHVDEHFFDVIDTEEKAYVLGFIAADGCVSNKTLTICIKETDKEILEKIKKVMNSEHKIYPRKGYMTFDGYKSGPSCALEIKRDKLADGLEKHGIVARKTYILEFPDFLPEELMPHYIRGYFDGDGCFSTKGSRAVKVTILSSMKFCDGLNAYLNSMGIISHYEHARNADERIGRLDITAKDSVKKFLNYIYQDATIFLDRKHERYLDYYYRGKPITPYKK